MTYRGRVKGGVVVLDAPASLPDGAEVEVTLRGGEAAAAEGELPTLYERYKSFIGIAEGLPSDLAAQHDHYLYGTPKRE